jgi:hypothetical protein
VSAVFIRCSSPAAAAGSGGTHNSLISRNF